ncbi:MAG: thiamine pyrophosphate-dependent enzyme [Candidatus Zixiibacteriota bacterium]
MHITALVDKLRAYKGKTKPLIKDNKPLPAYGGLKPSELRKMYHSMLFARRIEMEEKLLLRKGYCRFVIGCGGKELIDVVGAQFLRPKDPFFGYYRNKAFDMQRGASLEEKMKEAIGDRRGQAVGGMIQPSHSAYPDMEILPQASPTGSHSLEAAGLGDAIVHPTPVSKQSFFPNGRYPKDAVVYCSIGEGSTSSPEFSRAVFYSVFDKAPVIYAIYNCGWAISVSVEEQFPEGNPTTPFEGFQRFGLKIFNFDGTDIKDSIKNVKKAVEYARSGAGPVLMNIKVTREESHSGSDDQSFYMKKSLQQWHITNDCSLKTGELFIKEGILSAKQLGEMWDEIDKAVTDESAKAVADYHPKTYESIMSKVYYNETFEDLQERWKGLIKASKVDRKKKFAEWAKKSYYPKADLPETQGPMTMRSAINYTLMELFAHTSDVILFGEDVADFSGEILNHPDEMEGMKGKGGVFLVSKNLQREFGKDRCFNTPLDEAGILGRATGHVLQGRRPIPEIQFLDYISPAYQMLKDRICTMSQRSNGQWYVPMVIRCTYGGYKQGAGSMWHSEANIGTFINIPGLHVVVPSNARDAAGLLRTAFISNNPVLFCESVALYNRRDWEGIHVEEEYPAFEELIPFGKAAVYNEDKTDVAIITYGATVHMARRVAELAGEKGIGVRVVDLRTIRPLDEQAIKDTVKACGKVVILTEDRWMGGTGATLSSVITQSEYINYLEAPIKLVTAIDARVSYGVDGDEACLPNNAKIMAAIDEVMTY